MYKTLTIHKGTGNYCIDKSLLISFLSNNYCLSFLNLSSIEEVGNIYAVSESKSRKNFFYPGTTNQEEIFNTFINKHVKVINNSIYLINVIINNVKYDKVSIQDLIK